MPDTPMGSAAPRFERSCPRTVPIKGPKGWCDYPLTPHDWTDVRTDEDFWCPGYWHDVPPPGNRLDGLAIPDLTDKERDGFMEALDGT